MGVCGHCGYKMQAHSYVYKSRVNKTRYFYYRCPVRAYPALYSPSQCDLPTFRVEEVDNAVWQWVTSFLANPDNLARGMNYYLAEREAADAPLKARLEGIQSLIADNRRQLERLLDLYLSGDYAREILIERKSRLEDTIAALEQQGHELVRQLEQTLTREQIEGIQSFADGIARGLDTAAQDFQSVGRLLNSWNYR